jgi:ABC-2 type transport system ATP-binding protein
MRTLIYSLAGSDPPVTILLTSHNLTEVEELCARVGVISRGRIRALDTPKNLRALHRQTQRVELTVRGLMLERAREALAQRLDDLELKEEGQTLRIAFLREADDARLDEAVRLVQENGGELLSVDSERATLLDVLESYETEQYAGGEI